MKALNEKGDPEQAFLQKESSGQHFFQKEDLWQRFWQQENLRLRLLQGRDCLEAQGVWREVFCEDTEAFTDYYFSHKAAKNRGLVLEGPDGIRSMLYLTPEHMRVGGHAVDSAYVVGVATRKQYRHRGYMAALLQEAFRMLHRERMPFLFLMPASPDIYTPFGFTYIYDRPVWDVNSLQKERLTVLGEQDADRMAAFAQAFLEKEKGVYVCRDRAYYITQLLETKAQEGCIFSYEGLPGESEAAPAAEETAKSHDAGDPAIKAPVAGDSAAQDIEKAPARLSGLCMYTCEGGEAGITEVLAERETEARFVRRREGRRPAIMARLIDVPRMLSMLKSEEPFSFVLAVEDALIAENNGCFLCEVGTDATKVISCGPETAADVRLSVAELAAVVFGYERSKDAFLSRLVPFSPVWINEIV